jgi:hypothetical protein
MDDITKRALTTYVVIVLAATALLGAATYAAVQASPQYGALALLPLAIAPFFAARIAHKQLRSPDGPFKGLVWGGAWISSAWALGLLTGGAAIALAAGLGAMSIDPSMSGMIDVALKQAQESGTELPDAALGMIRVTTQITAVAGISIGVVFTGALACLGTLPWLGWFTRRTLALGRLRSMLALALLWGITGIAGALAPMPEGMDTGMSLLTRGAISALSAACLAPISLWLFLRTGSAVVPAIFQATLQGMAGLAMYYGADMNYLLAPPTGLLLTACTLFAGLGLWVLKDPGGEDLAIRADTPASPPSQVSVAG